MNNSLGTKINTDFKNTVPPNLSILEQEIFDRGLRAAVEKNKISKIEARSAFIKSYNKPEILNINTEFISQAVSMQDLINKIRDNDIYLISRDALSGAFNLYTNDELLKELNFINRHLVLNKNNTDAYFTDIAKRKVAGITRAGGLRVKILSLIDTSKDNKK